MIANAVASLTTQALKGLGRNYEQYADALVTSCERHPPPFGEAWYGERYRELSADPGWFAHSLVANAQKEGDGARKLWELAGRTPDPHIAEAVRLHAIDESRHAMLYLAMLELVFEDSVPEDAREALDSISPRYRSTDCPTPTPPSDFAVVLDEIIQMNIGEIRTRIHQLLLQPVIKVYCAPTKQTRLKATLDSLLDDETRHIDYTASIIDRAMTQQYRVDWIRSVFASRVAEFNEITLAEVGVDQFTGE